MPQRQPADTCNLFASKWQTAVLSVSRRLFATRNAPFNAASMSERTSGSACNDGACPAFQRGGRRMGLAHTRRFISIRQTRETSRALLPTLYPLAGRVRREVHRRSLIQNVYISYLLRLSEKVKVLYSTDWNLSLRS